MACTQKDPSEATQRAYSQQKRFNKNFSEITDLVNNCSKFLKTKISFFKSSSTFENEQGEIVQSPKERLILKITKNQN